MKTNIIIFSKNRTLQLKSLLLSLHYYSDVPEENINIIYKADPDISYEPLIKRFKCNFIKQGNFLEDVRNVVNSSKSGYVWFMVDDLIYRQPFSLEKIESFLDTHKDVESFCLRLGKNIERGKAPEFIYQKDDFCVFDTSEDLGKYWNYFWELCSSVYRRELVLKYLSKCRPDKETFPNPFEFHYYACMPTTRISGFLKLINSIRFVFKKKSDRVACFSESKCFIHGVNLVAELNDGREEPYEIKLLHKRMEEGYVVDFIPDKSIKIDSPSPGHKYFKLIPENDLLEKIKNIN